jgi:hypothetical protein
MNNEHISNPKKGIPLKSVAPYLRTGCILGENIDSERILKEYNGILIDFFRGAF